MKNIYIALMSEQTVPNYIVYKELSKTINFEEIILLHSDNEKRSKVPAENILNTLGDINIKKIDCGSGEEILKVRDVLCKISGKLKNSNIYLNITGGTKVMSLEAYNYFLNNYSNSVKIYYSGFASDQITCLNCNENLHKYKVNINEYLSLYGVKIDEDNEKRKTLKKSIIFKKTVAEYFVKNYLENEEFKKNHIKAISILRKVIPSTKNNKKKKTFRDLKKINLEDCEKIGDLSKDDRNFLESFCKDNNIPIENGILKKVDTHFITGDYLEFFIFSELSSLFDEEMISPAVHLKFGEVKNEIDGIFIYNNTLYLIECKTSLGKGKDDISKKVIEEREAFLNLFGSLKSKILFITLDEEIKKVSMNRSQNFNQDWVFGDDVLNIKEVIQQKLGLKNA